MSEIDISFGDLPLKWKVMVVIGSIFIFFCVILVIIIILFFKTDLIQINLLEKCTDQDLEKYGDLFNNDDDDNENDTIVVNEINDIKVVNEINDTEVTNEINNIEVVKDIKDVVGDIGGYISDIKDVVKSGVSLITI